MFWTFWKASFSYHPPTKTFAHHHTSGENTSTQILHLTQNTLSDYQNNGAIGKLTCLTNWQISKLSLPLPKNNIPFNEYSNRRKRISKRRKEN